MGTPPVLSMRALDAALDVFDGVPLEAVRAKSLALSGLVLDRVVAMPGVEPVTPLEPARRGSQVSLRMDGAYEITQALIARGVVGDFRAPDLLRLGFAPLYLRFVEVWDAMDALAAVRESGEWRDPRFARASDATVT